MKVFSYKKGNYNMGKKGKEAEGGKMQGSKGRDSSFLSTAKLYVNKFSPKEEANEINVK